MNAGIQILERRKSQPAQQECVPLLRSGRGIDPARQFVHLAVDIVEQRFDRCQEASQLLRRHRVLPVDRRQELQIALLGIGDIEALELRRPTPRQGAEADAKPDVGFRQLPFCRQPVAVPLRQTVEKVAKRFKLGLSGFARIGERPVSRQGSRSSIALNRSARDISWFWNNASIPAIGVRLAATLISTVLPSATSASISAKFQRFS